MMYEKNFRESFKLLDTWTVSFHALYKVAENVKKNSKESTY